MLPAMPKVRKKVSQNSSVVPVEESDPVADDSFFDDAVFLGDSRTEGFELFSGMKHGDFYWASFRHIAAESPYFFNSALW